MILVIKHVAYEGPGTVETFFKTKGFQLRTVDFSKGEVLPGDLSGIEAVISMGGPMNVYEEAKYPFLKEEDAFIKKVLREEVPFLGICLGAQLLAKAAGAKVTRAPKKEIGWFKISLTNDGKKDLFLKGLDRELTVFQWHGDTFSIPPNGKNIAESVDCKNQALKVGRCAYGLQFHIEVTKEIIADWVNRNFKDPKSGTISAEGQKMVEDYEIFKNTFNTNAEIAYRNFLTLIQEKAVA